jgi:hypothetical protein
MSQFGRVEADQAEPTTIYKAHGVAVVHACYPRFSVDAIRLTGCSARFSVRGRGCELGSRLSVAKTPAEFIDLSGGVENLLFASKERVTLSAHLDVELIAAIGGARLETVAAATGHSHFVIIGMYANLHWIVSSLEA